MYVECTKGQGMIYVDYYFYAFYKITVKNVE